MPESISTDVLEQEVAAAGGFVQWQKPRLPAGDGSTPGTPPYTFRDDDEREELAVLAAEAILVDWTIWGRDNAVQARNRVRVPLHDGPAEFTLGS